MSTIPSSYGMPVYSEIKARLLDLLRIYGTHGAVRSVTGICAHTQRQILAGLMGYYSKEVLVGLGFSVKDPFGDMSAEEVHAAMVEKFGSQKAAAEIMGLGINSMKKLSSGSMLTFSKMCEVHAAFIRGNRAIPKLNLDGIHIAHTLAWSSASLGNRYA